MLIKSFSLQNFRSITSANELPLSDYSILIGPNNEGKSNILKALVMMQEYIANTIFYNHTHPKFLFRPHQRRTQRIRKRKYNDELIYDWNRDFPIKFKKKINHEKTIFVIVYSLSKSEKKQFKKTSNNILVKDLQITISLNSSSSEIEIVDTNSSKKKFRNISSICEFISTKIQIQYISAIRTSEETLALIDKMISSQLFVLQQTKKYKKILNDIEKLQKPILKNLSEKLTENVSAFLPQVKTIKLDSREKIKRVMNETTEVYINDGANTLLELKGDGIKSLLAISIIEYITKQRATQKNMVLVIEEPESHLHPNAIHKLNSVLREISNNSQVIISTHSPLLIDRSDISRNILVDKSKARTAMNIKDIRTILGVRIADNLLSAQMIILVEGEEDKNTLEIILKQKSSKIRTAMSEGIIIFDILRGVSNLSYKATIWISQLCNVYAFLDYDDAGIRSFAEASKKNLITTKNIVYAHAKGFQESELEDLFNPHIYNKFIFEKYGIDLMKSNQFRNNKKKWSQRVKESFEAKSKPWNNKIKDEIKKDIAEKIQELGFKALHIKQRNPIQTMISDLEVFLKQK